MRVLDEEIDIHVLPGAALGMGREKKSERIREKSLVENNYCAQYALHVYCQAFYDEMSPYRMQRIVCGLQEEQRSSKSVVESLTLGSGFLPLLRAPHQVVVTTRRGREAG